MTIRNCIACVLAVCLALFPPAVVHAQATYSDGPKYYQAPRATPGVTPASNPATAPAGAQALKPEELEQVVAPIALYPDSLLAQVLMASTYPLEVVQADRWVKQNPSLKDSPDALNKLTWDASVKSLINFPQVLTMMSEKLDWTVKLGDAFIADQKAVMDAVQRLRGKAYANGNLKSSKEQTVKVEAAPATAPAVAGSAPPPQVIVVESSSPSVVYVPTYNPTVVYGGWPYPSYPPYYYTPPGYVAGAALISFGVGVACGAAWGHAWGGCNWHGGEVDIDVNKNVNFNGNIDREQARANMDNRQGTRDTRQGDRQAGRDTRQAGRQGGASSFQHDPSHRQGVAYRDGATTERFKGAQASQQSAAARDAYRGRAEAGRQELSRGGADAYRGSAGGGFGGSSGYGGTYGGGAGAGAGGARAAGDYRGSGGGSYGARDYSGTRSSGFSGTTSSGSSARAASSRGQTSRSSGSYSRSSGGGGGYSRSSGGGGYSGGGARGGGARGGGGGRGGGGRR